MKRCPQCNRVETDDALVYCRNDGVVLVGDSSPLNGEAGTAQLGSGAASSEIETSILPHTSTSPEINRPTAPTTVLPAPSAATTGALAKPNRRKTVIALVVIATAVIAATTAVLVNSYLSKKREKTIESIAVLPFQNSSGDPNVEYLSDGIAESLINSLTQLQQLKVIARSTAFRYKGKDADPQTVGRELNVRAVLMGRIRQMGDRLNIQVDLVDAATGAQLWGEEYERPITDALFIKQAIAREVTEKLRLRLSGEQQQQLVRRETSNPEAYQFYLRGRYYWNKRSADGLKKAIAEFQQAIERDPNYALGYVGLTDCYLLLDDYAGVSTSEMLPKARAAVERALQIDDSLAEAHTSLAKVYTDQWRWAEAEQEFRRAIALNPNYPTAHHWFSSAYFRPTGQLDDALREGIRAQQLDPLSPIISNHVASILLQKGDINSAVEQLQKIIELDPRFPNSHDNLGWAFFKQGRYEKAIAEFQQAVELSGRAGGSLCDLGYIYAITGKRGEAIQILRELEERYKKREAIGMNLAAVFVGLGEKDQAFAWLEKDVEQRSGLLPDITVWFSFDDLRADPRYADLVRRMGLEP